MIHLILIKMSVETQKTLSKEIHLHIYECKSNFFPSQFFYEDSGSSIVWSQKLVCRIWPEIKNTVMVEIHFLVTDDLYSFEIKQFSDLAIVKELINDYLILLIL